MDDCDSIGNLRGQIIGDFSSPVGGIVVDNDYVAVLKWQPEERANDLTQIARFVIGRDDEK